MDKVGLSGKYQTYPEYKDSGVEWIEELPKYWSLSRIKYLCYVNDGNHGEEYPKESDYTGKGEGVPFIRGGNMENFSIVDDGMLYITKKKNDSMRKGRLEEGDILFMNRGEIGKLALISGVYAGANLNSQIAYLRSNRCRVSNKYLLYYLSSSSVSGLLASMKMGSVLTQFPIGDLLEIRVPYPAVDEQQKIAHFLDHETAKIDTLIDKQQQLIKLLKEKRQAVISHAVTKGLPSITGANVPMRDSGVEWLGEVPEHWSLPKIKWFYKTESGGTPNTLNFEKYYQDGKIPWIRTTDLNNGDLYDTPVAITDQAVADSACSIIPINSVLVAMYGGAGTIGKHSLLKFESTINQAVCAILPIDKIDAEFIHLYVEFYRPYWMVGAEGTRKDPNINQEVIRELMIPCPPSNEQDQIIKVTKKKLLVIDDIVLKSETNIKLMQERRTALISAAVTGKIDVRDWEPPHA